MNKEKMKAKCEAWIKEGMGSCRAPITYDELNSLLWDLDDQAFTIKIKSLELEKAQFKMSGILLAIDEAMSILED